MRGRLKAAFLCHLVVALGFVALGVTYLTMPRFMPYHARVANASWESLADPLRVLLLAFMRGSGAATLAAAISIIVILWLPFRRGERWARHAVPAVGLCATLPLSAIMLSLQLKTSAGPPLILVLAAVALQLVAWGLSVGQGRSGADS